jgi:hypothetical protein
MLYSATLPVFEAPDEEQHYAYVRYIASEWRLPPQGEASSAEHESSQPPLYYTIAALASSWGGDDTTALSLQPNRYYSNYQAPGTVNDNKNTHLHTGLETFPWQDEVLKVHLARLANLFLGGLTVGTTYLLAHEIFPEQRVLALTAAAIVAFNPQFLFISSAVNNDASVSAFSTLALWQIARGLHRGYGYWEVTWLGVSIGLAALSKVSALTLLPFSLLITGFRTWLQHSRLSYPQRLRSITIRWSLIVLIAFAISGWWYIRNAALYNDPLGLQTHFEMWWAHQEPLSLNHLQGQLSEVELSFWAAFGMGNVRLPRVFYIAMKILVRLAFVGLILWGIQSWKDKAYLKPRVWSFATLILWLLVTLVALLRWMQLVKAGLGRLLFPAIGAVAILLIWGLTQLVSCISNFKFQFRRFAVDAPHFASIGLTVALFLVSAASPFTTIRPAYARPPIYETESVPQPAHRLDWVYLEKGEPLARLRGYDLAPKSARPGETVHVTLYWEALRKTDANYTLFAQLFGREDAKVAQRDTYPGLGHYPTSFWQPGQVIVDEVPIPVASDAVAPTRLRLDVGLYQRGSGRLKTVDEAGNPVGATAGWLKLAPAEGHNVSTAPSETETDYQLSNAVTLIGYDLAQENETLRLALHWTCLAPMTHDYVVFVHLLIADERTLPVGELEPGVYQLKVGMYLLETGERLPAVNAAGERLPNDAIALTEIDLP